VVVSRNMPCLPRTTSIGMVIRSTGAVVGQAVLDEVPE
jgi:hypothetical protein